LKKFLKKQSTTNKKRKMFQSFDSRYYEIFKNLIYFEFSTNRLTLIQKYENELYSKVKKFNQILKLKELHPGQKSFQYTKLLHSPKSLVEFFGL